MAAAAGLSLPSSSFSAAAETAGVAAAVAAVAAAAAAAAAVAAVVLAPAANSEPNPRIRKDTGISYAIPAPDSVRGGNHQRVSQTPDSISLPERAGEYLPLAMVKGSGKTAGISLGRSRDGITSICGTICSSSHSIRSSCGPSCNSVPSSSPSNDGTSNFLLSQVMYFQMPPHPIILF